MNRLTDKTLLLLYSLGSCLLLQTGPVYVCFFFLAAYVTFVMEDSDRRHCEGFGKSVMINSESDSGAVRSRIL